MPPGAFEPPGKLSSIRPGIAPAKQPEPAGELNAGQTAAARAAQRFPPCLGDDPVAYPLSRSSHRRASSARASASPSPSTRAEAARRALHLVGSRPRTPSRPVRHQRRATKASVRAEARSSHCASSTSTQRRSSAASESSSARPARPGIVRGVARAEAEHNRHRLTAAAPGATSRRSQERRAQVVQAGIGKFHVRLDARDAARPRIPWLSPNRYSSSAVLPTPGSPRRTRTRLWPARTSSII